MAGSYNSEEELVAKARELIGMSFAEVEEAVAAEEAAATPAATQKPKKDKGKLGSLVELFLGNERNSRHEADFAEVGIELKVSPFQSLKNGDVSVGERMVLTMIEQDKPFETNFFETPLWNKCQKILMIFYHRTRDRAKRDQIISYVYLYTPSDEDLEIIKQDFNLISSYITAGRAHELSESLTNYLGAATKGSTAEKSLRPQFYPPHTPAKRRAFCFKRSYVDYVFKSIIVPEAERLESIVKDQHALAQRSFEDIVLDLLKPHVGKSDETLCHELQLSYNGKKNQWYKIIYALLGVKGERAAEFEKANISVRTVRLNQKGVPHECISLNTFEFKDLVAETWDDSFLNTYFDETKFLFVWFQEAEDHCMVLSGARFWTMSTAEREGPLKDCWSRTQEIVRSGVNLQVKEGRVSNNLPKSSENTIAHVRPHARRSAYKFADGTVVGNIYADASELPDGRWMTKQCFWLNKG